MNKRYLLAVVILITFTIVSCGKNGDDAPLTYIDTSDVLASVPSFNTQFQTLNSLLGASDDEMKTFLQGHYYRPLSSGNNIVTYIFQNKFIGFSDTSASFLINASKGESGLISSITISYPENYFPTPSTKDIRILALALDSTVRKNSYVISNVYTSTPSSNFVEQTNIDSVLKSFVDNPTITSYRFVYKNTNSTSAYIQKILGTNLSLNLQKN
ncbi:MAG: hypothetical protein DI598_04360 [Pseudopedobacter saltans]|uniref:Uncharacterized protein n=1 Tax=Pseudopedobacter saltans TaxID=151895 RepID=A0A2W5FBF1_9SPHI|nr:MAG: hypothetical protein DI598_04360 [Pseudopedobacter saltans]